MNSIFIESYEGVVASWSVCLPLDRGVWVHELAREIALCSCAGRFTLTVPLSTLAY